MPRQNSVARTLFAAGLLGLALSASQPAFAGTRAVHYSDLDLSTNSGRAKLDYRLRQAAKEVCGLDRKDTSAADEAAGRDCFAKSYADARRAKAEIRQTALAAR
ncbi:hypothetical protein Saro_3324 [Novosphingobium aromaticivorans DSM 12444]|uniref:UrcA family protein n=1 Tax=Novosphingobium aromaticivorans (strain ATCC 700278 / DSM 12444 / CCUG 56034 / CIP 105152 / NBRC 16084 / F199) TaxID=279238 RepID=Q2G314_NOVAD|nr:UrcA family protein [Novosphingobium aromaticivorans]ABD27759.1 hypothetical protein Saro_3324 [Novosphingobium aromaticivorans DSM 12444]SCY28304.1 UrcA family protein [Novosphingobium aromaticivorans]